MQALSGGSGALKSRWDLSWLTSLFFLRLQIFIRNRLKYALTGREVTLVVKQRLIKIDNKVRTDETYPAGFMGTLSAPSQRSLLYLEARHRE